jgi:plasmid stabilization system protein ParE
MRVRFSRASRFDLQDIAAYLNREHGHSVAQRFNSTLREATLSLRRYPRRAPVIASAPNRELRRLVSAPYVIVYEVRDDEAFVVRILHGAQDVDPILRTWGLAPPSDED